MARASSPDGAFGRLMRIDQLAAATKALIKKAQAGELTEDMDGGTSPSPTSASSDGAQVTR